ncbi:MAG: helix-turn-helix transcriptional regulator [Oscillospiraceae bacterium]|nr:helix-turn-helix transcriptional regulator [Oscillospiraceae bacterium]
MTNRVKELRKENHITQQQLADMLGITARTVISLEKGNYNPSVLLAYKISEVFNVYIEDVFIFDESDFELTE